MEEVEYCRQQHGGHRNQLPDSAVNISKGTQMTKARTTVVTSVVSVLKRN
jgi:hypothetical protein